MNSKVKLLLVPAVVAALGLAGCAEPETPSKICVQSGASGGAANPDNQIRVDDAKCSDESRRLAGTNYFPYYWFYMTRSYAPAVGYPIRGYEGSFNPIVGKSYSSGLAVSGVARGGFGSSARGFSGSGS